MQVLTPGHKYLAQHFENKEDGTVIQFIEKTRLFDAPSEIPTPEGLPNLWQLVTINDGTTNEELTAILIDRVRFLNNKFRCEENDNSIRHLEEALFWMEKRTKDRIARGVEGQHKA